MGQAIDAYEIYLRDTRANKPKSRNETIRRMRAFTRDGDAPLRRLDRARAEALYDMECTRIGKRGRVVSTDTHRNTLAEARTFGRWLVKVGWLRVNPFDGVEGRGKRRRGKPQLRIDEARRWTDTAFSLANEGKVGPVAALMVLMMGMRASEVTERVVRDLDDGGRLLWVPEAKTEAGKRTLDVPASLQPFLVAMTNGRGAHEPLLIGRHRPEWIRYWVKRICVASGVPVVCAHSMRGLTASIATESGAASHVVASQLGHEKPSMTFGGCYATRGSQDRARQQRALRVLEGGKSTERKSADAWHGLPTNPCQHPTEKRKTL